MNSTSHSMNKTVKTNLTNWDELSPLKEQQIKSIIQLSQFNQFDLDETETNAEETQSSSIIMHDERDSTSKDLVSQVNDDVNELLYNFDVNDIEDARIEKYVNNLNLYSKKCTQISESINHTLEHLNVLLENYSQVSEKTKSLHVACEQLLNDQVFQIFICF